jgi:hypothetical protein
MGAEKRRENGGQNENANDHQTGYGGLVAPQLAQLFHHRVAEKRIFMVVARGRHNGFDMKLSVVPLQPALSIFGAATPHFIKSPHGDFITAYSFSD